MIVLGISMISNGMVLTGNALSFDFDSKEDIDVTSTNGNPYVSVDPRIEIENKKEVNDILASSSLDDNQSLLDKSFLSPLN